MKVKITFKNIDQVRYLYNFIDLDYTDVITGNPKIDKMIVSILDGVEVRLFNKYKNQSIRPFPLKLHEAIALQTYYLNKKVSLPALEAATLMIIFNDLHQKIA